jgi:signal transduction histidine kinase
MLVVCLAAVAPLLMIFYSDAEDRPFRLTIAVLSGALFLAWWLGWRMALPLAQLKQQALAQAARAAPEGGAPPEHALVLDRDDEFGDLATAFNALLAALEREKREHEAFVADLVHELKNPVAAVRASAEALQRTEVDPKRAARLASILTTSSARLDQVVTRFLELARAQAGLPAAERQTVDAGELARGVADSTSADPRFANVTFTVAGPAHAVMTGVATAVESALRNLVENAASFAPLGEGEARVWVDVEAKPDAVILRVRDSGPGITEEDLPHVFDRFFTKRKTGMGTGLGLALVKAVAEGHGGRATVQSQLGDGATFSLSFPKER